MATIQQTPTSVGVMDGGVRGTSFGAIFSGVSIAVAFYLVLLILGAALGFTILSPWNFQEYAPDAIGIATMFWLIVTQIISSGGGGYVAGRLASTEWNASNLKNEGAHFYNAAHGLVVWALASIAIAFLLGTVASSILSGSASMITSVGKGVSMGAVGVGAYFNPNSLFDVGNEARSEMSAASDESDDVLGYALDLLLRPLPDKNSTPGSSEHAASKENDSKYRMQRREIVRIFINSIQRQGMSDTDKKYVAEIVADRTGMSHEDALKRINDTLDEIDNSINKAEVQAKKAIDGARHAAALAALWVFVSLFSGAVVAAVAAGYGGGWKRRRAMRTQKSI